MDAWWRANNYLTVGQIYLHGQPAAARAAGARAHQAAAARPLGHQPRPVVHLRPRVPADPADRPGDDLPRRARATAGRRWWPPATSRAPTARSTREVTQDEAGHAAAVPAVLRPGGIPSHVSVTTPGLDPRGRRARLRAGARVRRGDGQPRPARARGRRRRRGRDRPARGVVEGRLVPQPGARRRRAAGPAPQRRQDRRTDRAGPQGPGRGPVAARGPRLRRASRSRATTCPACTTGSPTALAERVGRRSARSRRAARGGDWDGARPRWPMIVLRTPKGWTGPDVGRRHPGAPAPGARTRCRCPACKDNPEHLRAARGRGCGRTGRRSCSTPTARPTELVRRANPDGDLRMSATPARQRRPAHPRPRPAGLPRLRGRRADARRRCAPSRPASSAR